MEEFEEVEAESLVDLKQDYYRSEMAENDKPSRFIVEMERKRNKLEKLGFDIKEADFLTDILGALPKGRDSETVGPYQMRKRLIEKDIEDNPSSYGLNDMKKDLKKVYVDLKKRQGVSGDKTAEGEQGFYGGGKPVKGRCYNCGQVGHTGAKCTEKKKKKWNGGKKGFQKKNGGNGQQNDKKRFNGKCHHCHKVGHKKADCWQLNGRPGEQGNVGKDASKDNPKNYEVTFTVWTDANFCHNCNPVEHKMGCPELVQSNAPRQRDMDDSSDDGSLPPLISREEAGWEDDSSDDDSMPSTLMQKDDSSDDDSMPGLMRRWGDEDSSCEGDDVDELSDDFFDCFSSKEFEDQGNYAEIPEWCDDEDALVDLVKKFEEKESMLNQSRQLNWEVQDTKAWRPKEDSSADEDDVSSDEEWTIVLKKHSSKKVARRQSRTIESDRRNDRGRNVEENDKKLSAFEQLKSLFGIEEEEDKSNKNFDRNNEQPTLTQEEN